MVWSTRRWILLALLAVAAIAAVIRPMQPVERYSAMQQAKIRSVLMQRGMPEVDGLAYFGTTNTPAPVGNAPAPLDINILLQDFPTAAGAIRKKVSLDNQYRAAMSGDRDAAMRAMARSFVEGEGSGSYQKEW